MSEAEEFFYQQAGYSWHPDETQEEGHRRTARDLASAEQWAKGQGHTFVWEADWDIGSHVEEFDSYDAEPETCEGCVMRTPDGRVLSSIWCIDDATPEYGRVVEAELAYEAQCNYDEAITSASLSEVRL